MMMMMKVIAFVGAAGSTGAVFSYTNTCLTKY